ncbi:MAG: preprotein translocase subunit SecY [Alphaproteobacteria bacterium]|nr:MAG: preprotein translocase subunit SecY [Alphaproteobacteria bacterium]
MVSAAEQLAANMNFGALVKRGELRNRILFTLGALIVYRLCTYVPLPGIDPIALKTIFAQLQQQGRGLVGMMDLFSGGALSRMSIIALNIMPYISSSIIMTLLTSMSPSLSAMKKEGGAGRKKINQYTRIGTVILTALQGYALAVGLEGAGSGASSVVIDPGMFFRATTVVTLVGGTMFLMWLGEQITARGVGNGISLIIFAGIVAQLPAALASTFELGRTGAFSPAIIISLLLLALGLIYLIIWVERAQRRLIVQYPKRQTGNRMTQSDTSHLPLKLNTAGVIPPIFASSLLFMPTTIASFSAQGGPEWLGTISALLGQGQPLYISFYVAGIVFFAFFYTGIVFNPDDTADNLKQFGGFLPGIRPGEKTARYLEYVLTRLTTVGAIYLSVVCVIPELLISRLAVPFYLGGTSLLIVVNVTMDTVSQIHSHMMAHQYEGLIKKARLRGRR